VAEGQAAHYLLKVSYDPATDRLAGVVTISARATEALCRFNLDFQGLTVRSVPAGLDAISNGRLVGRRTHGHRTTWVWDAPDPMAPYLATATIGQFDLRSYRTAQGLRMYDAVDPDLYGQPADPEDPASPTLGEVADGSLARQGEILDFLSGQFGPYPFSTGGGIVDDAPDLFFALEVQTRSIYPGSSFTDPVDGDLLVVHENAHQWFGDSVALAEWKHMWLNEGFATYAEWLWGEREDQGTTQEVFKFCSPPANPPPPRPRA
jgi:Peptidase family M1 domain